MQIQRAKYQKIYNAGMKQGGQSLAVEETFAELAADITAGNINAEGSGTSVVRAAMGSLAKSLAVLGIPVKAQPSFNEFANYVQAVSNDFKSGEAVTETRGRFGSNQAMGEGNNSLFFQLSDKALQEFEKKVKDAQKPAWTIEKGKEYAQSKITDKTKQTNLAEVIENFKKENGRAPRVLVWGGDQSGRGTYTTKNGTEIKIEGGISFAEDQENKDNGACVGIQQG